MNQESTIERRLLNMEDAATYLGISKHTIYTMVSQRRIPVTKIGKLNKFDRLKLDAFIEKNTTKPRYAA